MKKQSLFLLLFLTSTISIGQSLPDSCKLNFGTNLAQVADYMTEMPFVDLMKSTRPWYSKDIGNPDNPFNTEQAHLIEYRADGYPTQIPQEFPNSVYPQKVATYWADTDAWPVGTYTVLFDGIGELSFWGIYSNMEQVNPNKITFDITDPIDGFFELTIEASDVNDPIQNIRFLMPGTEDTYETQVFNQTWLNRIRDFGTIRFMDWGATNFFDQPNEWEWDYPNLIDWTDRRQPDYFSYATFKGVPYEVIIQLMNQEDLDGWICVPHRASNDYIEQMALLFKNNLEPERKLYVEFSNEIWNWGFGPCKWLNKYGCEQTGTSWPEGIVPYVQNCMDIWTTVFGNEVDRIERVVGVQTGWQDLNERILDNMELGKVDAIAPTGYFGLNEAAYDALDNLGANATPADVAYWVRQSQSDFKTWLRTDKETIADVYGVKMSLYEAGQHLKAEGFGTNPPYNQAILDLQRDTAMYNLYDEWFDFLRTLQTGDEPLLTMNFTLAQQRDELYGSWGILETINQDLSVTPAPKYQAIIDNIHTGCNTIVTETIMPEKEIVFSIYPNPASNQLNIVFPFEDIGKTKLQLFNAQGQMLESFSNQQIIDVSKLSKGLYFLKVLNGKTTFSSSFVKM